jgi:hypothetical protein
MVMTENDTDAFTSIEDQPPKRGRGRPPKSSNSEPKENNDKPPRRPNTPPPIKGWTRAAEVEKVIYNYLTGIAAGVAFVNVDDAKAISDGAARLAHELVELGKIDKRYRGYLETLCAPGKYGGVLIATGAIVLPIAINHNLIPQFNIPFVNQMDSANKEGEN